MPSNKKKVPTWAKDWLKVLWAMQIPAWSMPMPSEESLKNNWLQAQKDVSAANHTGKAEPGAAAFLVTRAAWRTT